MEFQYEYAGRSYPVRIKRAGEGFNVDIGEEEYAVTAKEIKPGFFVLNINDKVVKLSIASEGDQRHIFFHGSVYRFTRAEGKKRKSEDYDSLSPEITSPISGKIVKVDAENGDAVETGQTLVTIEAMKMEYQVKAPFAGIVKNIKFNQGDQVEIGTVLVEINKEETEEGE